MLRVLEAAWLRALSAARGAVDVTARDVQLLHPLAPFADVAAAHSYVADLFVGSSADAEDAAAAGGGETEGRGAAAAGSAITAPAVGGTGGARHTRGGAMGVCSATVWQGERRRAAEHALRWAKRPDIARRAAAAAAAACVAAGAAGAADVERSMTAAAAVADSLAAHESGDVVITSGGVSQVVGGHTDATVCAECCVAAGLPLPHIVAVAKPEHPAQTAGSNALPTVARTGAAGSPDAVTPPMPPGLRASLPLRAVGAVAGLFGARDAVSVSWWGGGGTIGAMRWALSASTDAPESRTASGAVPTDYETGSAAGGTGDAWGADGGGKEDSDAAAYGPPPDAPADAFGDASGTGHGAVGGSSGWGGRTAANSDDDIGDGDDPAVIGVLPRPAVVKAAGRIGVCGTALAVAVPPNAVAAGVLDVVVAGAAGALPPGGRGGVDASVGAGAPHEGHGAAPGTIGAHDGPHQHGDQVGDHDHQASTACACAPRLADGSSHIAEPRHDGNVSARGVALGVATGAADPLTTTVSTAYARVTALPNAHPPSVTGPLSHLLTHHTAYYAHSRRVAAAATRVSTPAMPGPPRVVEIKQGAAFSVRYTPAATAPAVSAADLVADAFHAVALDAASGATCVAAPPTATTVTHLASSQWHAAVLQSWAAVAAAAESSSESSAEESFETVLAPSKDPSTPAASRRAVRSALRAAHRHERRTDGASGAPIALPPNPPPYMAGGPLPLLAHHHMASVVVADFVATPAHAAIAALLSVAVWTLPRLLLAAGPATSCAWLWGGAVWDAVVSAAAPLSAAGAAAWSVPMKGLYSIAALLAATTPGSAVPAPSTRLSHLAGRVPLAAPRPAVGTHLPFTSAVTGLSPLHPAAFLSLPASTLSAVSTFLADSVYVSSEYSTVVTATLPTVLPQSTSVPVVHTSTFTQIPTTLILPGPPPVSALRGAPPHFSTANPAVPCDATSFTIAAAVVVAVLALLLVAIPTVVAWVYLRAALPIGGVRALEAVLPFVAGGMRSTAWWVWARDITVIVALCMAASPSVVSLSVARWVVLGSLVATAGSAVWAPIYRARHQLLQRFETLRCVAVAVSVSGGLLGAYGADHGATAPLALIGDVLVVAAIAFMALLLLAVPLFDFTHRRVCEEGGGLMMRGWLYALPPSLRRILHVVGITTLLPPAIPLPATVADIRAAVMDAKVAAIAVRDGGHDDMTAAATYDAVGVTNRLQAAAVATLAGAAAAAGGAVTSVEFDRRCACVYPDALSTVGGGYSGVFSGGGYATEGVSLSVNDRGGDTGRPRRASGTHGGRGGADHRSGGRGDMDYTAQATSADVAVVVPTVVAAASVAASGPYGTTDRPPISSQRTRSGAAWSRRTGQHSGAPSTDGASTARALGRAVRRLDIPARAGASGGAGRRPGTTVGPAADAPAEMEVSASRFDLYGDYATDSDAAAGGGVRGGLFGWCADDDTAEARLSRRRQRRARRAAARAGVASGVAATGEDARDSARTYTAVCGGMAVSVEAVMVGIRDAVRGGHTFDPHAPYPPVAPPDAPAHGGLGGSSYPPAAAARGAPPAGASGTDAASQMASACSQGVGTRGVCVACARKVCAQCGVSKGSRVAITHRATHAALINGAESNALASPGGAIFSAVPSRGASVSSPGGARYTNASPRGGPLTSGADVADSLLLSLPAALRPPMIAPLLLSPTLHPSTSTIPAPYRSGLITHAIRVHVITQTLLHALQRSIGADVAFRRISAASGISPIGLGVGWDGLPTAGPYAPPPPRYAGLQLLSAAAALRAVGPLDAAAATYMSEWCLGVYGVDVCDDPRGVEGADADAAGSSADAGASDADGFEGTAHASRAHLVAHTLFLSTVASAVKQTIKPRVLAGSPPAGSPRGGDDMVDASPPVPVGAAPADTAGPANAINRSRGGHVAALPGPSPMAAAAALSPHIPPAALECAFNDTYVDLLTEAQRITAQATAVSRFAARAGTAGGGPRRGDASVVSKHDTAMLMSVRESARGRATTNTGVYPATLTGPHSTGGNAGDDGDASEIAARVAARTRAYHRRILSTLTLSDTSAAAVSTVATHAAAVRSARMDAFVTACVATYEINKLAVVVGRGLVSALGGAVHALDGPRDTFDGSTLAAATATAAAAVHSAAPVAPTPHAASFTRDPTGRQGSAQSAPAAAVAPGPPLAPPDENTAIALLPLAQRLTALHTAASTTAGTYARERARRDALAAVVVDRRSAFLYALSLLSTVGVTRDAAAAAAGWGTAISLAPLSDLGAGSGAVDYGLSPTSAGVLQFPASVPTARGLGSASGAVGARATGAINLSISAHRTVWPTVVPTWTTGQGTAPPSAVPFPPLDGAPHVSRSDTPVPRSSGVGGGVDGTGPLPLLAVRSRWSAARHSWLAEVGLENSYLDGCSLICGRISIRGRHVLDAGADTARRQTRGSPRNDGRAAIGGLVLASVDAASLSSEDALVGVVARAMRGVRVAHDGTLYARTGGNTTPSKPQRASGAAGKMGSVPRGGSASYREGALSSASDSASDWDSDSEGGARVAWCGCTGGAGAPTTRVLRAPVRRSITATAASSDDDVPAPRRGAPSKRSGRGGAARAPSALRSASATRSAPRGPRAPATCCGACVAVPSARTGAALEASIIGFWGGWGRASAGGTVADAAQPASGPFGARVVVHECGCGRLRGDARASWLGRVATSIRLALVSVGILAPRRRRGGTGTAATGTRPLSTAQVKANGKGKPTTDRPSRRGRRASPRRNTRKTSVRRGHALTDATVHPSSAADPFGMTADDVSAPAALPPSSPASPFESQAATVAARARGVARSSDDADSPTSPYPARASNGGPRKSVDFAVDATADTDGSARSKSRSRSRSRGGDATSAGPEDTHTAPTTRRSDGDAMGATAMAAARQPTVVYIPTAPVEWPMVFTFTPIAVDRAGEADVLRIHDDDTSLPTDKPSRPAAAEATDGPPVAPLHVHQARVRAAAAALHRSLIRAVYYLRSNVDRCDPFGTFGVRNDAAAAAAAALAGTVGDESVTAAAAAAARAVEMDPKSTPVERQAARAAAIAASEEADVLRAASRAYHLRSSALGLFVIDECAALRNFRAPIVAARTLVRAILAADNDGCAAAAPLEIRAAAAVVTMSARRDALMPQACGVGAVEATRRVIARHVTADVGGGAAAAAALSGETQRDEIARAYARRARPLLLRSWTAVGAFAETDREADEEDVEWFGDDEGADDGAGAAAADPSTPATAATVTSAFADADAVGRVGNDIVPPSAAPAADTSAPAGTTASVRVGVTARDLYPLRFPAIAAASVAAAALEEYATLADPRYAASTVAPPPTAHPKDQPRLPSHDHLRLHTDGTSLPRPHGSPASGARAAPTVAIAPPPPLAAAALVALNTLLATATVAARGPTCPVVGPTDDLREAVPQCRHVGRGQLPTLFAAATAASAAGGAGAAASGAGGAPDAADGAIAGVCGGCAADHSVYRTLYETTNASAAALWGSAPAVHVATHPMGVTVLRGWGEGRIDSLATVASAVAAGAPVGTVGPGGRGALGSASAAPDALGGYSAGNGATAPTTAPPNSANVLPATRSDTAVPNDPAAAAAAAVGALYRAHLLALAAAGETTPSAAVAASDQVIASGTAASRGAASPLVRPASGNHDGASPAKPSSRRGSLAATASLPSQGGPLGPAAAAVASGVCVSPSLRPSTRALRAARRRLGVAGAFDCQDATVPLAAAPSEGDTLMPPRAALAPSAAPSSVHATALTWLHSARCTVPSMSLSLTLWPRSGRGESEVVAAATPYSDPFLSSNPPGADTMYRRASVASARRDSISASSWAVPGASPSWHAASGRQSPSLMSPSTPGIARSGTDPHAIPGALSAPLPHAVAAAIALYLTAYDDEVAHVAAAAAGAAAAAAAADADAAVAAADAAAASATRDADVAPSAQSAVPIVLVESPKELDGLPEPTAVCESPADAVADPDAAADAAADPTTPEDDTDAPRSPARARVVDMDRDPAMGSRGPGDTLALPAAALAPPPGSTAECSIDVAQAAPSPTPPQAAGTLGEYMYGGGLFDPAAEAARAAAQRASGAAGDDRGAVGLFPLSSGIIGGYGDPFHVATTNMRARRTSTVAGASGAVAQPISKFSGSTHGGVDTTAHGRLLANMGVCTLPPAPPGLSRLLTPAGGVEDDLAGPSLAISRHESSFRSLSDVTAFGTASGIFGTAAGTATSDFGGVYRAVSPLGRPSSAISAPGAGGHAQLLPPSESYGVTATLSVAPVGDAASCAAGPSRRAAPRVTPVELWGLISSSATVTVGAAVGARLARLARAAHQRAQAVAAASSFGHADDVTGGHALRGSIADPEAAATDGSPGGAAVVDLVGGYGATHSHTVHDRIAELRVFSLAAAAAPPPSVAVYSQTAMWITHAAAAAAATAAERGDASQSHSNATGVDAWPRASPASPSTPSPRRGSAGLLINVPLGNSTSIAPAAAAHDAAAPVRVAHVPVDVLRDTVVAHVNTTVPLAAVVAGVVAAAEHTLLLQAADAAWRRAARLLLVQHRERERARAKQVARGRRVDARTAVDPNGGDSGDDSVDANGRRPSTTVAVMAVAVDDADALSPPRSAVCSRGSRASGASRRSRGTAKVCPEDIDDVGVEVRPGSDVRSERASVDLAEDMLDEAEPFGAAADGGAVDRDGGGEAGVGDDEVIAASAAAAAVDGSGDAHGACVAGDDEDPVASARREGSERDLVRDGAVGADGDGDTGASQSMAAVAVEAPTGRPPRLPDHSDALTSPSTTTTAVGTAAAGIPQDRNSSAQGLHVTSTRRPRAPRTHSPAGASGAAAAVLIATIPPPPHPLLSAIRYAKLDDALYAAALARVAVASGLVGPVAADAAKTSGMYGGVGMHTAAALTRAGSGTSDAHPRSINVSHGSVGGVHSGGELCAPSHTPGVGAGGGEVTVTLPPAATVTQVRLLEMQINQVLAARADVAGPAPLAGQKAATPPPHVHVTGGVIAVLDYVDDDDGSGSPAVASGADNAAAHVDATGAAVAVPPVLPQRAVRRAVHYVIDTPTPPIVPIGVTPYLTPQQTLRAAVRVAAPGRVWRAPPPSQSTVAADALAVDFAVDEHGVPLTAAHRAEQTALREYVQSLRAQADDVEAKVVALADELQRTQRSWALSNDEAFAFTQRRIALQTHAAYLRQLIDYTAARTRATCREIGALQRSPCPAFLRVGGAALGVWDTVTHGLLAAAAAVRWGGWAGMGRAALAVAVTVPGAAASARYAGGSGFASTARGVAGGTASHGVVASAPTSHAHLTVPLPLPSARSAPLSAALIAAPRAGSGAPPTAVQRAAATDAVAAAVALVRATVATFVIARTADLGADAQQCAFVGLVPSAAVRTPPAPRKGGRPVAPQPVEAGMRALGLDVRVYPTHPFVALVGGHRTVVSPSGLPLVLAPPTVAAAVAAEVIAQEALLLQHDTLRRLLTVAMGAVTADRLVGRARLPLAMGPSLAPQARGTFGTRPPPTSFGPLSDGGGTAGAHAAATAAAAAQATAAAIASGAPYDHSYVGSDVLFGPTAGLDVAIRTAPHGPMPSSAGVLSPQAVDAERRVVPAPTYDFDDGDGLYGDMQAAYGTAGGTHAHLQGDDLWDAHDAAVPTSALRATADPADVAPMDSHPLVYTGVGMAPTIHPSTLFADNVTSDPAQYADAAPGGYRDADHDDAVALSVDTHLQWDGSTDEYTRRFTGTHPSRVAAAAAAAESPSLAEDPIAGARRAGADAAGGQRLVAPGGGAWQGHVPADDYDPADRTARAPRRRGGAGGASTYYQDGVIGSYGTPGAAPVYDGDDDVIGSGRAAAAPAGPYGDSAYLASQSPYHNDDMHTYESVARVAGPPAQRAVVRYPRTDAPDTSVSPTGAYHSPELPTEDYNGGDLAWGTEARRRARVPRGYGDDDAREGYGDVAYGYGTVMHDPHSAAGGSGGVGRMLAGDSGMGARRASPTSSPNPPSPIQGQQQVATHLPHAFVAPSGPDAAGAALYHEANAGGMHPAGPQYTIGIARRGRAVASPAPLRGAAMLPHPVPMAVDGVDVSAVFAPTDPHATSRSEFYHSPPGDRAAAAHGQQPYPRLATAPRPPTISQRPVAGSGWRAESAMYTPANGGVRPYSGPRVTPIIDIDDPIMSRSPSRGFGLVGRGVASPQADGHHAAVVPSPPFPYASASPAHALDRSPPPYSGAGAPIGVLRTPQSRGGSAGAAAASLAAAAAASRQAVNPSHAPSDARPDGVPRS